MGLDLAKAVQSVLLGFILFIALMGFTISLGAGFNKSVPINKTFSVNNTFNSVKIIEDKIRSKGTDTTNQFFPAIAALFTYWDLAKSVLQDFTFSIQNFLLILGQGNPIVVMIGDIIIAIIFLTVAIIVLMALFKLGGFKLQ